MICGYLLTLDGFPNSPSAARKEKEEMKRVMLLLLLGLVALTASAVTHAAYTTYTGTTLPDPNIWTPDDKYGGSETWTRIDTDTYPGTDGYTDIPPTPITYNVPVLRLGAPGGWNGFMTSVGSDPEVSLGARFRLKYTNNTVGYGPAILSLFTKGGPGLSLSVADKDYPTSPDRYWYTVNQFHVDSQFRRLTAIQTLPLKSPVELNSHGEPITYQTDWQYHEAWLYVNATYGITAAYFDGQEVWRGTLIDMLNAVDGVAEFGAATIIQHSAGRTDNRVFFEWVTVVPGAAGPVVTYPVVTNIAQAKSAANGTPVSLSGVVVSEILYSIAEDGTTYMGSFAVQATDGSIGIRVVNTNPYEFLSPGDVVNILGGTETVDGERIIKAKSFTVVGSADLPKPIGLSNRATAGGVLGAQQAVCDDATVDPAKMSSGANNIGLFTTIFGKVTKVHFPSDGDYKFDDYFYVDDGSALNDGSGYLGIRCRPPSENFGWAFYELPAEGQYVTVTGVMGTTQTNGKVVRYFWTWSWRLL